MPSASELVIGITPWSCSRFSAPIVAARTRDRASCEVAGQVRVQPVRRTMIIETCSASALRPKGSVGFVDDASTWSTPARAQHVGGVPAAAALDVEGVHRAAVEHGQGVGDRQALVEPVGVQAHLHVVLLGATASAVSRVRRCAPVSSWTLNPHTPPSSASSSGPLRRRSPGRGRRR